MIKSMLVFIVIALLISCKTIKKSSESVSQTHLSEKLSTADSLHNFTVSFISIGSGIDHKAKAQYNDFVQQFNEKNDVEIIIESTSWGREGETDYCMNLINLTSDLQELFMKQSKEVFKNSSRIRFKVNNNCNEK